MKIFFLVFGSLLCSISFAQDVGQRLDAAIKKMDADAQFKHASISLYVINSKTGKPVFTKNTELGLATASTLKVVTSTAAFELLGKDYRYKTDISYDGAIAGNTLNGNLFITASGDPTLGSWRWNSTTMDTVHQRIIAMLKANNITAIAGDIIIDEGKWSTQATPRGWTWDDIGNYYGAGARALNWHENQYDLILKQGKDAGDPVEIVKTEPELQATLFNELKTGKPGSGDNSVIYLPEDGQTGYVRGTVEGSGKTVTVSGAMPNAAVSFAKDLAGLLQKNGIAFSGRSWTNLHYQLIKEKMPVPAKTLMSLYSPSLDSITYWFLQKSVNLFGEAFVKTMAYEKTGFGSTETGVDIIKDFWSKNGIEPSALNMIDGSGLSPANRVTTNALVTVMQYAKQQTWFSSFYNALPEQNGIKMKSGYIGGVRSYTGYIKSKTGAEYTFAFIINNFDGSPGAVREKMWKLLDLLK
jgi:D-alanyl-D-alanine carboxypeptidase/D-alanyl-D-alanine-endopeptidase (penicillin-binding protein 4)